MPRRVQAVVATSAAECDCSKRSSASAGVRQPSDFCGRVLSVKATAFNASTFTSRNLDPSRNAARADVFDYIERFYNPIRSQSTLGYLSPAHFDSTVHVA